MAMSEANNFEAPKASIDHGITTKLNPARAASKKVVREKPVRRTHAERRQDSQSRILAASLKLLVERGYDQFSLQDVGRFAGCSHELINHYFDNKDGLLSALADYIMGSFASDAIQMPKLPPGFASLAQQVRYYAAVADRNFLAFSAYMRIAAEAPFRPTLQALVMKRTSTTLTVFIDAIKAGQVAGEIRDDIDATEYANVIYEFLRGHADVRLLRPHATSTTSTDVFVEILRAALSKERTPLAAAKKRAAADRTM